MNLYKHSICMFLIYLVCIHIYAHITNIYNKTYRLKHIVKNIVNKLTIPTPFKICYNFSLAKIHSSQKGVSEFTGNKLTHKQCFIY